MILNLTLLDHLPNGILCKWSLSSVCEQRFGQIRRSSLPFRWDSLAVSLLAGLECRMSNERLAFWWKSGSGGVVRRANTRNLLTRSLLVQLRRLSQATQLGIFQANRAVSRRCYPRHHHRPTRHQPRREREEGEAAVADLTALRSPIKKIS